MAIKLICAVSQNNVIGFKNRLPWSIAEDLKRFKEMTSGNIIVMGRKTYESIGRPLPNRRNIVLSKNKDLKINNVEIFNSPDEVIDIYSNDQEKKDLFIIGGNYIYELFIHYCEFLCITYIDKKYDGDAFFPEIDWKKWQLVSEVKNYDEKEESDFYFRDFKRI